MTACIFALLVQQFATIIADRNKALQKKAVNNNTFVYWAAPPQHMGFSDEEKMACTKFTNCLNAVIKLHGNMRVLKLVEFWDPKDLNLVNHRTGRFTDDGKAAYWRSLDSGITFNIKKREAFLSKAVSSTKVFSGAKRPRMEEQEDPCDIQKFFWKHRNGHDKYHWHRDCQPEDRRFLLPHPHHRR